MTPEQAKEAADELRRYADRVDAMVDTLDNKSSPCDCCGTIRWSNWAEHQLAERLVGIAERMDTTADALERQVKGDAK